MTQSEVTPTIVLSRDGALKGVAAARGYRCNMEGCTGRRLAVKWPDGRITRPCTKGMTSLPDGSLQIG